MSDCIQLRRNGDCDRAILRAQDVLNEVELTHEQAGLLHLQLGKAHQQLGRFARASASFRHAERLFAACGQPRRGDVGFYSALVAMLWLQSGESGAPSRCEAEDACVAATSRLDAERTAHNAPPRRRAAVANKQGLLFALRGDEVQALGRYTEALGLYGLLGDLGGQAYSYHRMGLAYRALGKLSEAGDTIERAVALYMRCGPSERLRLVQAQQLVAELREVPR